LIKKIGGHFLLHRENYHDWGAMAVAFVRSGSSGDSEVDARGPSLNEIQMRYRLFKNQMASTRATLATLNGRRIYGYGAAQMLPVLAYHLGTDFSQLTAVLDDDPAKDGIGYWNLPVRVMQPSRAGDISDASVLITAIDNVKPIMTKLLANRPHHILYPFHII
jgi:hypothetical protein